MNTPAKVATVVLMEKFRPYLGMLFFAPEHQVTPKTVRFNATVSFVNTGNRKIIVTNAHVYTSFKRLQADESSLRMFITGADRNTILELREEYLTGCGDDTIDLAVFALPNPIELEGIGKTYFDASPWPAPRPKVGATAVIVGFPGAHRQPDGTTLRINLALICDRISACGPRHLILVDEASERISVRINQSLGDTRMLGGMSGSPVSQRTRRTSQA